MRTYYQDTKRIITQAVRPGFKFRLSFFPRSVTNRRLVSKAHAPPVHAYSTWNLQRLSSRKVSTDSMISGAMKSHTNEQTVQGRQPLKDVKRFQNGSLQASREINLRANKLLTFWVNHESCYTKGAINRGYQLFSLVKSIFRSVFVILDVIVNQAQERLSNKSRKVTSVRVHLSKMLWQTS